MTADKAELPLWIRLRDEDMLRKLRSSTQQVKRQAGQMEQALGKVGGPVGSLVGGFGQIGKTVGALGGPIGAATAAIGAFAAASSRAADRTSELVTEVTRASERLRVDVTTFDALRVSAMGFGASAQDVESVLGDLTQKAVNNEKDFQNFGIAVRDASGQLLDTEQILANVADRIARASTETERFAIADDLASDAGRRLLPILRQGSEAINQLVEARRREGGITEELVEKNRRLLESQGQLRLAFEESNRRLSEVSIPLKTKFNNALVSIIESFGASEEASRRASGELLRGYGPAADKAAEATKYAREEMERFASATDKAAAAHRRFVAGVRVLEGGPADARAALSLPQNQFDGQVTVRAAQRRAQQSAMGALDADRRRTEYARERAALEKQVLQNTLRTAAAVSDSRADQARQIQEATGMDPRGRSFGPAMGPIAGPGGTLTQLEQVPEKIVEQAQKVTAAGAVLQGSFTTVFSGLGSAIGSAASGAENAMASFLGNMISMIGQLLIQVGTAALVLAPLGFLNPAFSVGAGAGAAALAAGVAMTAVGAAMGGAGGGSAAVGAARRSRGGGLATRTATAQQVGFDVGGSSAVVVNFNGIVGDPRAVARQLQGVMRRGASLGA